MDRGAEGEALFTVQLSLPRDARFVGMLRKVTGSVFTDIGAPESAADDIQLALTEACANAIRHAVDSAEYAVRFSIDADGCEVEVMDLGPGFEPPSDEYLGRVAVDPSTETGRGLVLMRALVDDLEFTRQDNATCVILRKKWPEVRLARAGQTTTAPADV